MKPFLSAIFLTVSLLVVGSAAGDCVDNGCLPPSYLYQPAFSMDDKLRGPAEPYVPQPGDIFLATDKKWVWRIGHQVALVGPPHHSGVVLRRPDGSLAVIEAGPFMSEFTEVNDLLPTLAEYAKEEKVWIRKRCTPLTCEQSERLTEFTMNQDGKRFAILRIAWQLTPFRPRGPVKTIFIGRPWGNNRIGWICSELVMESLVYAGLTNPETARPVATSPRDLFFGRSRNPYINCTLDLNDNWHPPARWVPCPSACRE